MYIQIPFAPFYTRNASSYGSLTNSLTRLQPNVIHFQVDKSALRKLDLHGGGQNYGRRIELLTEETASPQLIGRLNAARDLRKPRAIINSSEGSGLQTVCPAIHAYKPSSL